jgi:deoxyribose-phosphate aldolase
MTNLDIHELASIIDISAVRTDVTLDELTRMADLAKHFRFICAFAMPCFTPDLVQMLSDAPDVHVGGVVGFPSGADTTQGKVRTARELIAMGCSELDMVINLGALKSGRTALVADDIRAVVDEAGNIPVKAILEIAYLTEEEIARASRVAVSAGVRFIKTGTGWAGKAATVEDVRTIKRIVGDTARIKVAGGVRSLDMMIQMMQAGCTRFGIGYASALSIMREAETRLGLVPYHALAPSGMRGGSA